MSRGDSGTGLEVAIVGMAGRFPGAGDVGSFWRNLRAGVESITFFSEEELIAAGIDPGMLADPSFVKARPVLDDADCFDAAFFHYTPREAELMDPQHRLFLECCWAAMEDAGQVPGTALAGVYAGTGMNGYLLHNLLTNLPTLQSLGSLQAVIGSDKDYLATRVSYKLDLQGPSLSVQSACSSSLVAVHLACQGLLNGECDLALAGGVSINLPLRSGYLYQSEGILSPDGHCRTFDARGQGTIFGSGVGVAVLRRLEDALAAGDRIRAVIKGSAVNNDGSAKVGFTAPRVEGQAKVIRTALRAAGVDPATVTYVEAHGTATPLGDPMEIQALTEVFAARAPRPGSCALGSVKTNVGHLDTAAGIAGLIKTVLALEHREIPPSLHFERPNPEIDLAGGPFYVNASLAPWQAVDGQPRRAGVSSFGIGGTNAHLVLEEAPPRAPGAPPAAARPWQLLVLSARSEAALERLTGDLADHLRQHPGDDLADVAFTLQTGRRAFEHRRMLICGDREGALAALDRRDPERLLTGVAPRACATAWIFPGQGAQHPGMAAGLYAGEATFRQRVDACAERLRPRLGLDLRSLLLAPPEQAAAAAGQLEQTHLAQPALYVVEVALAELWQEWGIEPAALLGHSVGEYAAAAVAGVFSLEDGLDLVAERARLMQELPPGAMLAVPRPAADLLAELPRELAVAAINAPGLCVVSGPQEPVAAFAARLAATGVETRRLHTSHAFHSPMMEPVMGRFAAAVARVRLQAPRLPVLSNVTGTWMTAAEATDPGYWARQLRQTVRFGEALESLFGRDDSILLEVGPSHTLSSLVRAHPGRPHDLEVVASLPHAQDASPAAATFLGALGRLWLAGAAPDWQGLHRRERRLRLGLPTYPFERHRFWIEPGRLPTQDNALLGSAPDIALKGAASDNALLSAVPDTSPDSPAPDEAPPAAPAAGAHPRPRLATPYAPPRTATERRIAAVWQALLGIDRIGVHDAFLELGGHSLLATQVVAELGKVLHVELPVRSLFETPTVARLAAAIEQRLVESAADGAAGERGAPSLGGQVGAATVPELPAVVADLARRHEPFPLSDVQQAYWIGRGGAFELGNVATHYYVELEGAGIDVARLERVLRRLIDRHDMLRAVVEADGRQRILAAVPAYRIRVLDVSGLPEPAAAAALADVRRNMSHQVLPGDRWPLFEVRASALAGGRVRLHVSFDFLIGDAWSIYLLTRDWLRFYADPAAPLPPLALSYRDYLLAEETLRATPLYRRSLEHWRRRLPSLPPGPALPLATRPAALAHQRFARRAARVEEPAWRRLKALAAQHGLTPSVLLLSAFCEVLATWSKGPRFLVNLTLFHRLPLHPQVHEVVGDFTSLTLLEVDASRGEPFGAAARRLQDRLLEDLEHRYVSGVRVLRELAQERGVRLGPMAPVVFTSTLGLPDGPGSAAAGRGEASLRQVFAISQTPQVWLDHQIAEVGGALAFTWDTVDELFPPGLLDDMLAAYSGLLDRLTASPAAWEERPRLVPAAQLLTCRPEGPSAPPSAALLHQLFHAQAAARPEQAAVIAPDRSLTYAELRRRSTRLAARLRDGGARPGALVAVAMEKGWQQAVAALAVLEAGSAYLPVDPALPAERFHHLLRHGEAVLAVTQPWLQEALEWPAGTRRLTVEDDDPGPDLPPLAPAQQPGDLAYVIFTSGSTGEPKGVMIDHRGAVNTLLDVNRRFDVGPSDRVLAVSALSFDLSVYDLFGTLAAGATVVIPPAGAQRHPAAWEETMRRCGVTLWSSVPALMEMLVEHLCGAARRLPESLRLVMLSGDWIPRGLPERIRAAAAGRGERAGGTAGIEVEIVSLGGATEASIWSILYRIGEIDPAWASIPYGRAMDNQALHVLDEALEPRPLWVPGQLYIGGAGLARGYWRDPRQTAASFVVHPRTGERLYRTGDLGRWLPDSNIEFLGREDFQVKVRGHRIELGEIEAALAEHPAVRAAAAAAHGERHRKRLVGYAVLAPGQSVAGEELRQFLAGKVPAYMVPAAVLLLPELPLTANGKVDRSALPAAATPRLPAPADAAAAAPADERYSAMAAIWAEVLGVDHVGADDNFFALGGDSILAIQIVSRANRAGLPVTADQIFTQPSIAALLRLSPAGPGVSTDAGDPAAHRHLPPAAAGAPVVGAVPLTPIQHWMFEQNLPQPHHWNQAVLLAPRQPLAHAALRRAVAALVVHHDALRLRFAAGPTGWRQFNAPPDGPPPLAALDLAALPAARRAAAMEAAAAALQASLDLAQGPLLRIAHFVLGAEDGTRLLVILHHLVVDGLSWRILLADLESAYRQSAAAPATAVSPAAAVSPTSAGTSAAAVSPARPVARVAPVATIALPPKTTSFRAWAERLSEHAWAGGCQGEMARWLAPRYDLARPLPVDLPGGERRNTEGSASTVTVALSETDTRALLQRAPHVLRAQIQEVLLAALAQALAPWAGGPLLVEMEVHGREPLFPDLDLSRTIGWFTSVYPLLLDPPPGDPLAAETAIAAVAAVKENLRRVPGKGLGYGVLRYLDPNPRISGPLRALPRPQIGFNYLGQFDQAVPPDALLRPAAESTGPWSSPRLPRRHLLFVFGSVTGGRLRMGISYSASVHRPDTVEALAAAFGRALGHLAATCAAPGQGSAAWVASDFPLAGLGGEELAAALRQAPAEQPVEDLYRLSSTQAGILFHGLYGDDPSLYVTSFGCTLPGLDAAAFTAAWQETVDRHAVLRTAFVWEGLPHPVQLVTERVTVPWRREDWRGLGAAEELARWEEALRTAPLGIRDVGRAPLLRLALFQVGEDAYRFLFVHHHLILDGWSLPLLLQEVFAAYAGDRRGGQGRQERQGRPARQALPRPFRDYIAWLQEQDLAAAESFWRRSLEGFASPTRIGLDRGAAGAPVGAVDFRSLRLTSAETAALAALARAHGLTQNTLAQGAWALVLARFADQEEVCFGSVVAGRPPAIPGVEGMLGVFINTLPVRLSVPPLAAAADWLRALQARQVETRRHEHSPLAQVRAWSAVPAGLPLFESILVFENYPSPSQMAEHAAAVVELRDATSSIKTSYPLVLSVKPGDELALSLTFDTARFGGAEAARMLALYRLLLVELAADAGRSLGAVPSLTAAERQQLLWEWNDTERGSGAPWRDAAGRFAEQAAHTPEAIAAACNEQRLTYGELERSCRRLAARLARQGAGPGAIVALLGRRGLDYLTAMLAVLRAGAAFLPLDPAHPRQRWARILSDSGVRLALAGDGLASDLAAAVADLPADRRPRIAALAADPYAAPAAYLHAATPAADPRARATEADPHAAAPEPAPRDAAAEPAPPQAIAYVIYTSGSTGAPKGVMVELRGMLNHLLAKISELALTAADVVAQTASQCFDISVWQFLAPLLAGGRVEILDDDVTHDPRRLLAAIGEQGITVLETVPSLLRLLLDELADRGSVGNGGTGGNGSHGSAIAGGDGLDSLRWLIATGEALPADLHRRWLERVAQVPLLNAYGPTECADRVTHQAAASGAAGAAAALGVRVPIGRPLANSRIYLLGRAGAAVPAGTPAELHIGGAQVGRGYLGRPELTAERFVPDPFGAPGSRLYRTGDLARHLAGGEIEFLGRIDHQVKVRGHRIELGEIEAALAADPAVRQAVVVAREQAGSHQRLVAYLTVAAGAPPPVARLRGRLAESLPDSMVPAAFVFLDALPLTASGKVDRLALPAPGSLAGGDAYAAPRAALEETLAAIWAEVLGVERVGVHDSFFELGGDSILSIQAVARARRAGLRLTPQQIFERRTIAALAAVVEEVRQVAGEPGPVTGPVPLTPIQHWFFAQRRRDAHHFTQTLLLELRQPVAPRRLALAVAHLLAHHDAFRLRFAWVDGAWRQTAAAPPPPADNGGDGRRTACAIVDLSALPGAARGAAQQAAAAAAQGSLALARGPLVRAVLFHRAGEAGRLLLAIHHLAVDGVSWRILLEDLESACRQLERGGTVTLPPKTTSYQEWGRALERYAGSAQLAAQLDYWSGVAELAAARPLPLAPATAGTVDASRTLTVALDAEETEALLREVPRAYQTEVNDALLAALARAFRRWTGEAALCIDLEGHGREELFDGLDLSRTVGWFTSIFPVVLAIPPQGDHAAALKAVKEQLRGVPGRGLGFGVLRYLAGPQAAARLAPGGPRVSFNYLGQMDRGLPEASLFAVAAEPAGPPCSPRQERSHWLEINGGVAGRRLRLAFTHGEVRDGWRGVEALAAWTLEELRALIRHCRSVEAGGFTPSDFPMMSFTQGELDGLVEELRGEAE
jgi:amino acid adenylation domain-containing protein/non-ribosomal peptide synthase protein (TIGR01720 family)